VDVSMREEGGVYDPALISFEEDNAG